MVRVDKQADTAFARVICLPIAPVRGARQLLVLHYLNNVPPRPAEEPDAATIAKDAKAKKGSKPADGKTAADKSAPAKSSDKPAGEKAAADKPAAARSAEKAPAKSTAAEKKSAAEKKPAADKNARPQATPGAQP